MTDQEFETIALAIKAAYPNSSVLPDKYAMKTWYQVLGDLDYRVVENAVLEHISTSIFPPSIAEIREKCAARLSPIVTDWGEAWEEVQKAIRKYGSYQEEEAVTSLSHLTAVAVRRMGFQSLCHSENTVADRAHFQRIYEGMVKEEKRQTQLPEFVKAVRTQMIEQNTVPIAKIQSVEQHAEMDEMMASPEHIDDLMERLKREIGGSKAGD